jgi:hypothetical protein
VIDELFVEEDAEARRDDLWRTLQTVSDWIRVADAKAGATLTVDGVVMALLASRLRGSTPMPFISTLGLSTGIGLAAVSGLLAIWAVIPRARRLGADSMVHYGTIAAFESAAAYHDATLALHANSDVLAEALTKHIWIISRSARIKYMLLIWGIRLLAVSLIVGLFAFLL